MSAKYPVVVSDGIPKAGRQTLTVEADGRAQWNMLEALINSDSTLLLRDPFGDITYVRIVGSVDRVQRRKMPYPRRRSLEHNAAYCQAMMNRLRDILPAWTLAPEPMPVAG